MPYQIGGSLSWNAVTYVERRADAELYDSLLTGTYCHVLNARQMGKSSLLIRTQHRLQAQGHRCGVLDLTTLGSESVTPSQWYKGLATQLLLSLDLLGHVPLKQLWQDWDDLPFVQRLSRLLDLLLTEMLPQNRLFLFIDEVDTVLGLPFGVDEFFMWLRFCYNHRPVNDHYHRLTIALFGSASPTDFIQDKNHTPFNIGQAIDLGGFQWPQAQPLMVGFWPYEDRVDCAALLEGILGWTDGQPFLTQKVCQLVATTLERSPQLRLSPDTTPDFVAQVIQKQVIHQWQSQDEPEHLRTIRHRLLYPESLASRLLGIYQRILEQGSEGQGIDFEPSLAHWRLLLSGVVKRSGPYLRIKNPIYGAVFNPNWVQQELDALRPYAKALEAWQASHYADHHCLLRHESLQQALNWSNQRHLSDLDYRFLAASQVEEQQRIEQSLAAEKQERTKAEVALQVSQEAQALLVEARQGAKAQLKRFRLGFRWAIPSSMGMVLLVLLVRGLGLLQSWELSFYDYLIRSRPAQPLDDRIVIIGIHNDDIVSLGQFPIPDWAIAEAIQALKPSRPRVIGLTLFRDVPVEPGGANLNQAFATTPNLVGIYTLGDQAIPPPPVLQERQQVAIVDQVLDSDKVLRRTFLSLWDEQKTLHLSLGLRLALDYLKPEGINPTQPDIHHHPDLIEWGNMSMTPLGENTGGYYHLPQEGYQILLNYRGDPDRDKYNPSPKGYHPNFSSFSLQDLLQHRIDPSALADRIVLIGYTGDSVRDVFFTPYSSQFLKAARVTPSVEIHAHVVSALLDGALGKRSPLVPLARLWEQILLGVAGALGLLIMNQPLGLGKRVGILGGTVLVLLGMTHGVLHWGYWLPWVPMFLSLVGAAAAILLITKQQEKTLELRVILDQLLALKADKMASVTIALEYLKQAEGSDLITHLLEQANSPNAPTKDE